MLVHLCIAYGCFCTPKAVVTETPWSTWPELCTTICPFTEKACQLLPKASGFTTINLSFLAGKLGLKQ